MKTKDQPKLFWPIEKLHNWDRNPRTIKDEDFDRLKKQIHELGEYKPLIITEDGEVIGGNMRLKAYLELGFKECWVSIIHPKDDAEKLKYALSDNDQAGNYVEEDLNKLLNEYKDQIDLSEFNVEMGNTASLSEFLDDVMKKEEAGKQQTEIEPDKKSRPKSALGEIYHLGPHLLMCGDATNSEHVAMLMGEKRATLAFLDPPYNVEYEYNEYKDKMTYDQYKQFCVNWFTIAKAYSAFQVITPGTVNLHMWGEIEKWKSIAPWIKMNAMNNGEISYLRKWEPIIFYGKTDKRRDTDIFDFNWEVEKDIEHTCIKPISMIVDIVTTFSERDDIVIDFFMGSGSTLVACQRANRVCYGMELDPFYVDVVRKRYAREIGKEAEWEELTI